MRISYKWLQDFLDIEILGLDVDTLASHLSLLGFAVEGIDTRRGDSIFDLEVTTNRPDCLSHLGIARELAAQFRLKLKYPDFSPPAMDSSLAELPASVSIENADLCPRYTARLITGIEVGESPSWLKGRLEAVGQRSVNNIVDITNYVLFEVGHPLHAFDYDRLEGGQIVVRTPREGEQITTLDDVERIPQSGMLLICDAQRPVALGGIMGGADSEVGEHSRTILLESAYFDPASIRSTSRGLALNTEASYRFERGADPEMATKALNRASQLICSLAGGRCVGPVIDEYPVPEACFELDLRPKRVSQVLGIDVPVPDILDILRQLEFVVDGEADRVHTKVPSFRRDVRIEDDLVEEVARHYGYDRIPSHYPASAGVGRYDSSERYVRLITEVATANGFSEAVNFSFTQVEREGIFGRQEADLVAIGNPLTLSDTHLRASLIPGLLESLQYNLNRNLEEVRLFEIGTVFHLEEEGKPTSLAEETHFGLVMCGQFYDPFWKQDKESVRYHHLKGVLEELARQLGVELGFRRLSSCAFLHPGVAAEVVAGQEHVGLIGRLHPQISEAYKVPFEIYLAEVQLDGFFESALPEPCYRPVDRFPRVERDLSFLIDKTVEFSRIKAAVQTLNISELKDLRLIDLYQGPNLPENKVSLTVRLTFSDPERTLTQQEVSQRSDQVFDVLRRELAVESRS